MNRLSFTLFACLACTVANAQSPVSADTAAPPGPLTPVASLDIQRYMGTWYEIAKYPNRFQKKCVAQTTAQYRLEGDGTVQVINRCRQESGDIDEAIGEARQTGPATSPRLKVRFAPSWLSWLPFVWGDYWVVDLDARYELAAVSEPKKEYLWVLSRTPAVEPGDYAALLARLKAQGFDLNRLVLTPQQ